MHPGALSHIPLALQLPILSGPEVTSTMVSAHSLLQQLEHNYLPMKQVQVGED